MRTAVTIALAALWIGSATSAIASCLYVLMLRRRLPDG
jgi:hypothetical protein